LELRLSHAKRLNTRQLPLSFSIGVDTVFKNLEFACYIEGCTSMSLEFD
jgi:hypothetical protein